MPPAWSPVSAQAALVYQYFMSSTRSLRNRYYGHHETQGVNTSHTGKNDSFTLVDTQFLFHMTVSITVGLRFIG